MLLRITLTYFTGGVRIVDVLNHHDLTLEAARERRESILETMQDSLKSGGIFAVKDDAQTLAIPPGLLNQTHIMCEIVEE